MEYHNRPALPSSHRNSPQSFGNAQQARAVPLRSMGFSAHEAGSGLHRHRRRRKEPSEIPKAYLVCPEGWLRHTVHESLEQIPVSKAGIENYDQIFMKYCGLVMRYHRRYVAFDYLWIRLNEVISKAWTSWIVDTPKRIIQHKKLFKERSLDMLQSLTNEILDTTYDFILRLAMQGRRLLKKELPGGNVAIKAIVGEGSKRACYVICEPFEANHRPTILALETGQEFNRRQRRRLKHDKAGSNARHLSRQHRRNQHRYDLS